MYDFLIVQKKDLHSHTVCIYMLIYFIVGCLAERRERTRLLGTHRSARCMHLKSCHLHQPIANISFACFICQNFIPSKMFSNIISCNVIYYASGLLKLWESYRSRPSAGNKKSIRIVNFPAGRTRSRCTAAYNEMNFKWNNKKYTRNSVMAILHNFIWKFDVQLSCTSESHTAIGLLLYNILPHSFNEGRGAGEGRIHNKVMTQLVINTHIHIHTHQKI